MRVATITTVSTVRRAQREWCRIPFQASDTTATPSAMIKPATAI
jgi:hypothetical protein